VARKGAGGKKKEYNFVDREGKDSDWETPESILVPVRALFGGRIPLDAASRRGNPTKADRFYTPKENGLVQPWDPAGTFVNPPFSKGAMPPWCEKILLEAEKGVPIVAVLPCGARYSTKYWQDYIFSEWLHVTCWHRGRVGFLRPDGRIVRSGNTYDTQVMGFNIEAEAFAEQFWPLGSCFSMVRL